MTLNVSGPTPALIGFINDTYAPPTPVTAETELVRSEIIDSYSIVELIAFIEETFGVRVPDEEVRPENFRTAAAMHAMIVSLETTQ